MSSFWHKKLDIYIMKFIFVTMNIATQIASSINLIPEGKTFGYSQLNIAQQDFTTAAKAIERLYKKGVIKKLSKGVFYRPKQSIFGELRPSESEILKDFLYEDGKRIAYVTGSYLYNRLGLTTQLTHIIRVASFSKTISINRGNIVAKPVKSYALVTEENYQLLGILDAFKDIKIIPDVDFDEALGRLSRIVSNLEEKGALSELVRYALVYPPRARALLGALLEFKKLFQYTESLKNSLNPFTEINIGISPTLLPTVINWNIK